MWTALLHLEVTSVHHLNPS